MHRRSLLLLFVVARANEWLAALRDGVSLQNDGKVEEAESIYRDILSQAPTQPDALHLLGLCQYSRGLDGIGYVKKALQQRPGDAAMLGNLGELLRAAGHLEEALDVLSGIRGEIAQKNFIVVAQQLQRWDLVVEHSKDPLELGEAHQQLRNFDLAEIYYSRSGRDGLVGLGVVAQKTGMLEKAEEYYRKALPDLTAQINLASVYHERGDLDIAIEQYRAALRADRDNPQALNNLGAALTTMGRHEEAVEVLELCLKHTEQPQALVNLATHYANEGQLDKAREFLQRARVQTPDNVGILLRETTMMSPIYESTLQMCVERIKLAWRVLSFESNLTLSDPVSSVEQVHFYLPYAGLNDRPLQEHISHMYFSLSPELNFVQVGRSSSRRRIGFVSKFFGEHEPHGLLLEFVAKLKGFTRVLLPIVSPGRLASEKLRNSVDEIVNLGLNFLENRRLIVGASLDVLIYADMLSEPMTYFLGFSRMAQVQCVFWGNPITTGRPDQIDYFISADRMETGDDSYSEQVVLLGGQGIWYRKPPPPHLNATVFGDVVTLMCPQSNFKLHPEFDLVVAKILRRTAGQKVQIVVTEGRRQRWTRVLKKRMLSRVDRRDVDRLVFLPRQKPGEDFDKFIAASHVLLHPFPFGGSRTSSDGLAQGVPVLTRPVSSLRGRMAYSFYETMNMTSPNWTVCARSTDEYVEFATRLALDKDHRDRVARAIEERSHLIWEDESVVEEWQKFLDRVVPLSSPQELYKEGKLELAAAALRRHIALGEGNEAKLRSDLGATLQQLGDFAGAERELRRSLSLSDSKVALNNLAVTLHESGRLKEASEVYELIQFDDPIALNNAANADRDAGNVEAAVERLRRVLGEGTNYSALFDENSSRIIPTNSLVVMEHHLGKTHFTVPYSETPPTFEEIDPFGTSRRLSFVLAVQPFVSRDSARTAEIAFALKKNMEVMERVHCLFESREDSEFFECSSSEILGRRMRFSDVPSFANVVANADIFFDASLHRLTSLNGVVALTRWENSCGDYCEEESCWNLVPRVDSQDAWIFPNASLIDVQVEIGRPRADNFLAAYLKNNNVKVTSPIHIKAHHVHRAKKTSLKSYSDPHEIKGATGYVPLSKQWLF